MFESNESKAKSNRALVVLTLDDGSTATVSVRLSLSSKLSDTINNHEQFLDIQDADGKQTFLAKRCIRSIELLDVPKINQLNLQRRSSDRSQFDPYGALGVARGASPTDIRQAYHLMVRKYHPDRFATFDLPKEMVDYAAAMLVRVNLAYEQIGG